MHSVNLIEAWQIWFAGGQLLDCEMWGLPILWWGRIGKLMSSVGFLALVAEIIGHEKLQEFGNFLRRFSRFVPGVDVRDEKGEKITGLAALGHGALILGFFTLLGAVTGSLLYFWWFKWGLIDWMDWPIWQNALFAPIALFLAFLCLLGVVPVGLAALTIPTAVLRTLLLLMAAGLEKPNPEAAIKAVTGAIILVGFHFDLLAS
jgi:hypothetical protein